MLKRQEKIDFSGGFTLVELMVVVALIGILAAIAVPSMREFIAGQRVRAASFDLYASLVFARSEAIRRPNGVVRIAPAGDDWAQGWAISFIPASGSTTLLREQGAIGGISITDPDANDAITINHSGRPDVVVNLALAAIDADGVAGRCVGISLSGHTRTRPKPPGGC